MGRVYYAFITVYISDLDQIIRELNDCQDKIIAVTQSGNCYTIFYERNGNDKDGDGNG